jgi:hypothetical protein
MKDGVINLYYWKPTADVEGIKPGDPLLNFGDELGPEIIEKLFGYKINWTPDIYEADLLSVGSILQGIDNGNSQKDNEIDVWGSGYIWDKDGGYKKNLKFYAVRGKLTRDRLPKKYQSIPLGDPGLLCSLVYKASNEKTGKVGIIPHMADRGLPIIREIAQDSRFAIISPVDNPASVVKKITECKLILSSSLHGLIVADSFGVPNCHLKLSTNLLGHENDYKFNDYYSATNQDYRKADAVKVFDDSYLEKLEKQYQPIADLAKIQKELVKAFPYRTRNLTDEESASLESYRKDHEFRKVGEAALSAAEFCRLRLADLESENASLKARVNSFLFVKRSLRRVAGGLKRRIKSGQNR